MSAYLYNLLFIALFMTIGALVQKFVTWRRVYIERRRAFQEGQRDMLARVGPYCQLCDSNHPEDADPWRACNHIPEVYRWAGQLNPQEEDDVTVIHSMVQDPPTQLEAATLSLRPTESISQISDSTVPDGQSYDPDDDGLDTDDDPDAWVYENLIGAAPGPFWADGDADYYGTRRQSVPVQAKADRVAVATVSVASAVRVATAPRVAWTDTGPILTYPVSLLEVPDHVPSQWMLDRMSEHERRMATIAVDAKCWAIGVPDRTDQEATLILARELVSV